MQATWDKGAASFVNHWSVRLGVAVIIYFHQNTVGYRSQVIILSASEHFIASQHMRLHPNGGKISQAVTLQHQGHSDPASPCVQIRQLALQRSC